MLSRGALALLLLLLLFTPALCRGGLTPRLVRDIDETSYAGSSSPRQFGGVEHGVAFTAFGGRELWLHSDRDEDYGRVLRREEIRQLGGPFYAAREAGGGWSFWLAEGHPYNTVFRTGGKPVGRLGAVYPNPTWWDSPILFEAGRGSGPGLWTISINGPVELARPLPLEDGRLLRDYTPGSLKSFFIARHPTLGTSLWKTDGTRAGTLAVTAPSPGQTVPLRLAGVLRGRLLLAISGGEPELWWSDGSPRGLRPFLEIVHGRKAAIVSAARVVDGRAFLVIDDGRQGRQLWTSDGTAAGTVPITSFAPDPLRQIDIPLLGQDGLWYFAADDGVHGRELWRTDGTRQGTRLVTDLCPGPCSSDPQDLSLHDFGSFPGVFFTASAPGGPRALWQTDGTPQGTLRLTPPGAEATTGIQYDSYFAGFFAARTAALGEELWSTGGTPETTKLQVDLGLQEDSGSYPIPLGAVGDRLFFQTHAPTVGYGLWTSDGTAVGTYRIPAPPSLRLDESDSLSATTLGERMLLVGVARGPESAYALWATDGIDGIDGTGAGIVRLTPPGVAVSSTPVVVGIGGTGGTGGTRAVFSAEDAEHGSELWVTEGTPESTHLLMDLLAGPDGGVYLYRPILLRGQLFFDRIASDRSSEIWLTDGTVEGTRRLTDAYPFLAPLELSFEIPLSEAGGRLFFLGRTEAGEKLWVSDGTAAGTAPLEFAGSAGTVETLFPAANHVYFTVADDDPQAPFSGSHLWVTDGTPAGTVEMPGRPIISYYGDAMRPVPFSDRLDRLLFVNNDFRFWVTDGTAEGTFPLLDPRGNEIREVEGHAIGFKNHLVFATLGENGDDVENGPCYVWNGAGATVQQLENLSCSSFLAVGDRLYFTGFQPQTGAELWVMEDR